MWMKRVLVCAALCWGAHAQDEADYLDVDIPNQGRVRGYRVPGRDVFTFFGIPYATAPAGEHKFKAPLPPPTWDDTLVATDRRIMCPQDVSVFNDPTINVQEDCLVANVFVPDTEQRNLPVLVYVHGGGFLYGHGNDFQLTSLVSRGVIVVSFNYRVGVLGFLCLGNEHAPGNAGMKDQVALLRWVRDNIAAFGGNPNDVTVSGCSAGGSSVSLLMLSNLTDGLMHKVISESGSNIGTVPVQFEPLQNAKNHALKLNFTNVDDIDALTDFFTSLSTDTLAQDFGYMSRKDSSFVFTPCVERDVGQEVFLGESPINILRNKEFKILPSFVGFANLEGVFRYLQFYTWKDLMNENFSDFLPSDLEFDSETEREQMANTIKEFYFDDKPVSNETLLNYINYFSDAIFIQSILLSVKLQVEAGNNQIYVHEYSFNRNDKPVVPGREEIWGATHCAQLAAVADEGDESTLAGDYRNMKTVMRLLWSDFIVHGNPTPAQRNNTLPSWPPVNLGTFVSPHYSLGNFVAVGGIPAEERTRFWNPVYEKHFRIPSAPAPSSAALTSSVSKTLIGAVVVLILTSSNFFTSN